MCRGSSVQEATPIKLAFFHESLLIQAIPPILIRDAPVGRSISMRGFDFTGALFAVVLFSVGVGVLQFLQSWPQGQQGLLLYERACPIYSQHHTLGAVTKAAP
jgi:hypothetical protein